VFFVDFILCSYIIKLLRILGDVILEIKLSDHFSAGRLLRFTLPSIAMMIFTSIYGVVDGFFVSNFVGKTPFAAVNFIMPFLMILGALGFMLGTGGSALIAKTLGEGNSEKAKSLFSLIIYLTGGLGVVIAALGIIFLPQVAFLLGAKGKLLSDCVLYGRVVLLGLPFFMIQIEFQSLFITAEKPKLGFLCTLIAGVTNMVLDAVLVIPFGLVGAALATACSQMMGGIIPITYFARKNGSLLKLGRTRFDGRSLLKICTSGSSELMSNVSMSLVGMLYNVQLLNYAGENGVAAYGVMMYVNFVFISAFIGFTIGTAPIVSFHFGAGNHSELKSLLKKCLFIISAFALIMFTAGQLLAQPLSKIFVGYDAELLELTVSGFRIFAISFLFAGFAIYLSGFFTALNDGITSAIISFLRTLLFQSAAVLLLPLFLGVNGIWYSITVAEILAIIVGFTFLILKKNKFKYF
jgi:putative MATE family efflux protein